MKTLTNADIVQFFMSWDLPNDPKEAERLLTQIKVIVEAALIEVWNNG